VSTVVTTGSQESAAWRAPPAAKRPGGELTLALALAAGLGVITFVAGGGTALGSNTWAEVALTGVGAGIAIAAVLYSAPGRAWGAPALLLFAVLTAFTAVSIAWSVQPATSWVEANRAVSYLAAFAGALALGRVLPGHWRSALGAVAALTTVVCAYALLVKVFPATLDSGEVIGRLRLPFDYPNAVGQLAAMGLPAWLWIGSQREGGRLGRTLAVPGIGVLLLAIVLSYSRGALLIGAIGLAMWFALVPLRLRAALVLALAGLGAAIVSAWALRHHALTHDNVLLAARTSAGHSFGLVLLAMLAFLTLVGLLTTVVVARTTVSDATRRRIGAMLIGCVALLAVAGIGAVAASKRGLTGTITHGWHQITSPNSIGTNDNPGRLLALGSSRGRYWNEGLTVGKHALLAGVGAGGFATAHTRYYTSVGNQFVQHAHSYLIEAFANLGLIGVALSLALLGTWALAAGRAVGWRRRGPPAEASGPAPDTSAERYGLITMLTIVVVFGLGSSIDWTWLIPGTALPALVCAGWLAGRGPLERPVGRARRARLRSPGAIALGTGIAAVALLCAWMIAQPLRSANADAAAVNAVIRGDTAAALVDARRAASEDPLSVDPLFEQAAIYQAQGDTAAALAKLRQAVSLQPENAATWLQEGQLLFKLGRRGEALKALKRAAALDRDDRVAVALAIYESGHLK
jgi:hypothetical protein